MDDRAGLHAFAFQTGNWRVRHRKLRQRLAGSNDWYEFDGTCVAWELLGGAGNVDDHWIGDPSDPYAGGHPSPARAGRILVDLVGRQPAIRIGFADERLLPGGCRHLFRKGRT